MHRSGLAAQYGLGVWKAKGAAGYLTYHNGIYHTGHIEGDLTTEDVKAAAHAAGVDTLNAVDHAPVLEKNDALAQALGSPEQFLAAIDKHRADAPGSRRACPTRQKQDDPLPLPGCR